MFGVAFAATATASATTCSAGYKAALVGGKHTCLKVGQSCAEANNSQYGKYGFLCETVQGKYRLERSPHEPGVY